MNYELERGFVPGNIEGREGLASCRDMSGGVWPPTEGARICRGMSIPEGKFTTVEVAPKELKQRMAR
eukprot:scaffold39960_cov21-Prasinocladus_malaysianus.AAC.1